MLTWIASYPRSGNTWMRMLLHQYFGIESGSVYKPDVLVGSVPSGHWCRWMKTHHPLENNRLIKVPDRLKPERAIYVMRDGREVVVSLKKFFEHYNRDNDCSMEDIIQGKSIHRSWSHHVESWEKARFRAGVLVVKYEDMLESVEAVVARLCDFLDLDPLEKPETVSFDELHEAYPKMFRSGTNSTWKNELTDSQLQLFFKHHGETWDRYYGDT